MRGFTPGPWEAKKRPDFGAYEALAVYAGDYRICSAIDLNGKPANEANARLIASAPDLLAACEHGAKLFRKYEQMHLAKDTPDGADKAERNRDAAEVLEAAIARARGEAA